MRHMPTIGVIAAGKARVIESARDGLAELGLVENEGIGLACWAADGDIGQLPHLANELVCRGVDVIAAIGAVTARAVRTATNSIPMVYAVVVDPVEEGLADGMDENATGVTTFDPDQARMHVRMLRAIAPHCARIAVLADRGVPNGLPAANIRAIEEAGLSASLVRLAGPRPDLDAALAAMVSEKADALIVLEHPVTAAHDARLAELATDLGLPTVFGRDQSDAGGLFSFGTGLRRATRHMMRSVRRILDGERAGDLPIEILHRHELLVNVSTARRLGLDVPPDILDTVARGAEQMLSTR